MEKYKAIVFDMDDYAERTAYVKQRWHRGLFRP